MQVGGRLHLLIGDAKREDTGRQERSAVAILHLLSSPVLTLFLAGTLKPRNSHTAPDARHSRRHEALLCPSCRGSACLRADAESSLTDASPHPTPSRPPRKAGSQEIEVVRVLGTSPLEHLQWLRSRWPEMTSPDLPPLQLSPTRRKEPLLRIFSDILPEKEVRQRFGFVPPTPLREVAVLGVQTNSRGVRPRVF